MRRAFFPHPNPLHPQPKHPVTAPDGDPKHLKARPAKCVASLLVPLTIEATFPWSSWMARRSVPWWGRGESHASES